MLTEYDKLDIKIKNSYGFIDVNHSLEYTGKETIYGILLTLTEQQVKKINTLSDNINIIKGKAEKIGLEKNPNRSGSSREIKLDCHENVLEIFGAPDTIEIFISLLFNNE